jgi:hypothetical protein
MATRFSVSLAHAGCDHTGFVVWEERERADARGEGTPVMVGLPRGFVSLNSDDGSIEIVCAGCRQTIASAVRADAQGSAAPADPDVAPTAIAAVDASSEEPAARDEASAVAAPAGPDVAPTAIAAVDATSEEPAARDEASAVAAPADPDVAATSTAAVDATSEEPAARDEASAIATPVDQDVAATATAVIDATSEEPVAPDKAPGTADHAGGETAAAPVDVTAEDKVRADIEALFAEAEDVAPIRGNSIPPHLLDKLRHLADRMRQRRE